MRYILFCFIFILIIIGCECPSNLDTDKNYIPGEASYLSIINLLDNTNPISVYSMNIQVKKLTQVQPLTFQEFFKFPAGIVDFKLTERSNAIYNTIINTEKNEYYSMLLYKTHQEIESILLYENIDKTTSNLYIKFANFSSIDKVRFVVESNLPQNLEYNLTNQGITNNIAFPSVPFNIEIHKLPTDSIIAKIENISIDLGNITYFILVGDSINLELYQSINKYITN